MTKLPSNTSKKPSGEMWPAEASDMEIVKISREAARKHVKRGDVTGCIKVVVPSISATFYVKRNGNTANKLSWYKMKYQDATIVE